MATMGRSDFDADPEAVADARSFSRYGVAFRLGWAIASLGVLAVAPGPARAQLWTVEPSASSELTWTSNSGLGITGSTQQDTVLNVHPRVVILGEGARLRVSGAFGINNIVYLGGSQSNQALPEGDLSARLEAIERWLFLEASVRAVQTSADPFGVRSDSTSTSNTLTTSQARISPSIEASIDPLSRYRIRSDNTWSGGSSADSTTVASVDAGGYFGRHAVTIEHDPQPLGWRFEAERTETRYENLATTRLVTDLARVLVDYALAEDFSLGLRGGHERTNVVTVDNEGAVYGGQAKWQPSERTLLSADAEKRFFGKAWRLGFNHRAPHYALSFGLSRNTQSTPQALFEFPATGNVEALLLAMLTTRIPDPTERARVVRQLIASQGLPSSTLGPTSVFTRRLSIVTNKNVSVGLNGLRNSVVLSGFHVRTQDLPGGVVVGTDVAANNYVQYGLGLTGSHRLSMAMNVAATLEWSRIRTLAPAQAEVTTQRGASLQLNVQASPKSNLMVAGRYRQLLSTIAFSGREVSISASLDHRF